MGSVQRRQRCPAALSDKAASCGAATTAGLVLAGAGALLAALPAIAAREADPLHSPPCVQARAELDAALAAPGARGSARLRDARQRALHECLGTDTGRRERSGAPEPARAVAPAIAPGPPREALPAPASRAAPPPLQVPRAAMITTCDPSGCWDNQGRRFNRAGPLLIGPNGCQAQGGLVSCP